MMRYLIKIGMLLLISGQVCAQNNLKTDNYEPELRWSRGLKPSLMLNSNEVKGAVTPGQKAGQMFSDSLPQAIAEPVKSVVEPNQDKWSILVADKTLYRTMRRWAQEANYQLLWQIDRDYPIEASVTFENNFRGAIGQVMAGVALTDYPIQAIFNPAARVLRVVRHMDEGRR
jgi:hypothetical protein